MYDCMNPSNGKNRICGSCVLPNTSLFFENFCEMLSKMSKNFHLISLEVRLPVLVLQMKFKDFIRLGFLVALAAANASNDISKFNY